MMKRMLKAAIPVQELPGWFEVAVTSTDNKTHLTLAAKVDGKVVRVDRTLDQDGATIMDLVGLWPEVAAKVPPMAKTLLANAPVPRNCRLSGLPVPESDTSSKQIARLQLDAKILGKDASWHYDSAMDRLYMADLVEVVDWLKAIRKAQSEKPETEGAS